MWRPLGKCPTCPVLNRALTLTLHLRSEPGYLVLSVLLYGYVEEELAIGVQHAARGRVLPHFADVRVPLVSVAPEVQAVLVLT